MCGIAGIFAEQGNRVDPALLLSMTNSIRHRGPDDEGFLMVDTVRNIAEHRRSDGTIPEIQKPHLTSPFPGGNPNLALGWLRLGIIDPTPTGHQPMSSEDGTLWLIFNGEIYNYIELREQLATKGHKFKTKSDSEVILRSYEEWGKECLNRFNGMWAFALWDGRTRTLFCARDRFGVKPLYYTQRGGMFSFASEIKALLHDPAVSRSANHQMIYDYIVHSTIDHTDETLFSSVRQLPPSHFLTIDDKGHLNVQRYYTLEYTDELGVYSEAENKKHAERFRELLFDSVKLRLRTDVPLGSCLSGGLDSSTIVSIANKLILDGGAIDRALIGEHQKTFTMIYNDPQHSEKPFVDEVIAHTSASANFVTPNAERLWEELPKLVYHQDEPFNSTSIYGQWNVMRLARQNKVTVLLDGQGGDELLGGYEWHVPILQSQLLRNLRFGDLISDLSSTATITGRSSVSQLRNLTGKTARSILSISPSPGQFVNGEFTNRFGNSSVVRGKSNRTLQSRLYQEETQFNLQQLLHYEDRNSMAFSIEARVPFLDYRVVEYGMKIPAVFKLHNGWSKYPLRCATEGILPKMIQWRKDKKGFFTPQEEWTRALYPKIRSFLLDEQLRSRGFVDEKYLRQTMETHSSELPHTELWRIIHLEMWMRVFEVT